MPLMLEHKHTSHIANLFNYPSCLNWVRGGVNFEVQGAGYHKLKMNLSEPQKKHVTNSFKKTSFYCTHYSYPLNFLFHVKYT